MIGISIANSLGLKLSGINPDAAAFIAAAGITDTTQVDAVNTLVNGLQADGLWSKMKAVYPFVTDNRNLLSYTEFLGQLAFWSRSNVNITNDSTTAPNGTLTADTITSNSLVTASLNQLNLANSAGTYTQSFYIKEGSGGSSAVLYLNDGTTSNYSAAWFNLTSGTLLTVKSVGTFSGASSTITNEGNGWYRCSLTFTKPSTANSSFSISISPDNSFSTNVNSQIFAWGAQLELGSTATAYQSIATTQQAYIASQFKYNLKDPRDLDAAFRLVFNGGWTHSSTGATPNGTNGYADTKLNDSVLTSNSSHMSYYSRTNALTSTYDIGAFNGTKGIWYALRYDSNTSFTGGIFQAGTSVEASAVNLDSTGFYVAGKNGNTTTKFFKNGKNVVSIAKADTTATNTSIYLATLNQNGTPAFGFSTKQIAFSTIGDGLSDTDVTNLTNKIQAFQTALSRQV